jgi:hypothetical protein
MQRNEKALPDHSGRAFCRIRHWRNQVLKAASRGAVFDGFPFKEIPSPKATKGLQRARPLSAGGEVTRQRREAAFKS